MTKHQLIRTDELPLFDELSMYRHSYNDNFLKYKIIGETNDLSIAVLADSLGYLTVNYQIPNTLNHIGFSQLHRITDGKILKSGYQINEICYFDNDLVGQSINVIYFIKLHRIMQKFLIYLKGECQDGIWVNWRDF